MKPYRTHLHAHIQAQLQELNLTGNLQNLELAPGSGGSTHYL